MLVGWRWGGRYTEGVSSKANNNLGRARRTIDPRRIEVIDDQMAAVLRGMGAERRVARAFEMFEMMVDVARCGARAAHPGWDEAQVAAEVGRRIGHGRA